MKKLTLLFCLMLTAGFLVTFSSCTTDKMDELTIEQELPQQRDPTVPGVGVDFTHACWTATITYGDCVNLSTTTVTAFSEEHCECRIDLILAHFDHPFYEEGCDEREAHSITPCTLTNCNYAPLGCEG